MKPWQPVEHVMVWGTSLALPAACRCDRRLTEPHTEPSCPYAAPEVFYAGELERTKDNAPA